MRVPFAFFGIAFRVPGGWAGILGEFDHVASALAE